MNSWNYIYLDGRVVSVAVVVDCLLQLQTGLSQNHTLSQEVGERERERERDQGRERESERREE